MSIISTVTNDTFPYAPTGRRLSLSGHVSGGETVRLPTAYAGGLPVRHMLS
jgi:hypothetical protein